MYKVKFTPYRKKIGEIMLRQTKEGRGISSDGRYQFFINDELEEYDFWIVQGKGIRKEASCKVAPENTILLMTEPKSVLIYPRKYTRQFGLVCTCQEEDKSSKVVFSPPILPWFVGFTRAANKDYIVTKTYDDILHSETSTKTKLLSVITSDKAFTQGHLDRISFVEKLKVHYGSSIDVFGRGYNDFDDKWDVLAPYKYHIALENSSQKYYWTEKISDCFLTETYPIYYGCTNLSEYFSEDAYQSIDIHDFESAIEIIDGLIEEQRFEQSKNAIRASKLKVLTQYNMFDYMAALCDTMNPSISKKNTSIKPCRSIDDWGNVYKYLIAIPFFRFKRKFREVLYGKSILHQTKH